MICPYHLSLPSLIFIPNCSTLTVLLMCSFLILSFLVTPIANLNIFISATSISSTCFFVTATVSSLKSKSTLKIEVTPQSRQLLWHLLVKNQLQIFSKSWVFYRPLQRYSDTINVDLNWSLYFFRVKLTKMKRDKVDKNLSPNYLRLFYYYSCHYRIIYYNTCLYLVCFACRRILSCRSNHHFATE